ncbi:MAG: carbon-nitrogen hydrolase [Polyangiaceae bacterium]|nr:carbon-nitrogen hydrolase [Polyangiaceae bacterium]
MTRRLHVGLVQLAMAPDKATNVARACAEIGAAASRGATLICLPELFAGPYFCQTEDVANFDLAEPIPGPTFDAVAAAARAAGVTVVASLFERRAAGVYHNTSVTLGPDGALLGTYRKMHVPDDPLFLEKFYFTPGDLGFVAHATPTAVVGSLVCWDQWYPEAARLTSLRGAEVLCYPTAIGWQPYEKAEWGAAQLDAWRTVQRGHAIANGVFVAAVNRVGHEGPAGAGIDFWGHSFVADPFGVVLAEAGEGEETLVVELDLDRIEQVRRWWPFLRDRRVDAYEGLTRRLLDS